MRLPKRFAMRSHPSDLVRRRGTSISRAWVGSPRLLLLAFVLGAAAGAGCLPKDDLDDFSKAPHGGAAGSAGAAGTAGGSSAGAAGASADIDASSGEGGAAGSSAGQGGSTDSGLNDAGLDAGDPLDAATGPDSGAPDAG
jgi:hypothetical protein